MKVAILTEGGKDIGFGHVTRCLSLYQAFEEKNIKPDFIINGDETVTDLVEDTSYKIYNWIEEQQKLFNSIKNYGTAIIDSYLAEFKLYKKISEMVDTSVYIDDNNRINYPPGFIVNGSINAKSLNYPIQEGKTNLLGSKYFPIRKSFWKVSDKGYSNGIEKILLTFGGEDFRNLTPKLLDLLNDNFTDIEKYIVIGEAFGNKNEIENKAKRKDNLIHSPSPKQMKDIMIKCDIAISGAGQTLYELARCGTPTIAIGLIKNQINNIRGWKKENFIEYSGWWKDEKIYKNTMKNIEKLQDKDIRIKKSRIGKRKIDGKGPLRIINRIMR